MKLAFPYNEIFQNSQFTLFTWIYVRFSLNRTHARPRIVTLLNKKSDKVVSGPCKNSLFWPADAIYASFVLPLYIRLQLVFPTVILPNPQTKSISGKSRKKVYFIPIISSNWSNPLAIGAPTTRPHCIRMTN